MGDTEGLTESKAPEAVREKAEGENSANHETEVKNFGDKKPFKYGRSNNDKNWRQNDRRNGNRGYFNKNNSNYRKPWNRDNRPTTNEALIRESLLAREDKPLIFDLSSGRKKLELNDWFKISTPSKVKRSDGVGWIYVLSEFISEKDKKTLFETDESFSAMKEKWRQISEDNLDEVTFETFKKLAKEFDCQKGKWICHLPADKVDEIWQRLALEFAYEKLPKSAIAIKVSPVNDLAIEGGNSGGSHVLSVITQDMTNEKEVLGVEKALRSVIKSDLTYKPNIYTNLGIYR